MKVKNPRIKKNISLVDKINVIENTILYAFNDGKYTPYYIDLGLRTSIAEFLLDGVTFEKDDDIYNLTLTSKKIQPLVDKFYSDERVDEETIYCMDIKSDIDAQIEDIMEVEKQAFIHKSDSLEVLYNGLNMLIENSLNVVEYFNRQASVLTSDDIANASKLMSSISDGTISRDAIAEIIRKAIDFKVPEKTESVENASILKFPEKK